MPRCERILGALAVLLVLVGPAAAADSMSLHMTNVMPRPSANAARKEVYEVAIGPYAYLVVASAYDEREPPGLLVSFHGQGSAGWARGDRCQTYQPVMAANNLIGIAMLYDDGDNLRDTAGKVAAARAAVLQVQADYKIIAGRGVAVSASGGGVPHAAWYAHDGAHPGPGFPFIYHGLTGSNFHEGAALGLAPHALAHGWMIGVAGHEWDMAEPSLGASSGFQAVECLKAAAAIGPDTALVVIADGSYHGIYPQEVAAISSGLARLGLARAPFLYAPDYPESKLRPLVAQANANKLGATRVVLSKLVDGDDLALSARAADIVARIDRRARAQVDLARALSASDPFLGAYYGRIFADALTGHPLADELAAVLKDPAFIRRAGAGQQAFTAFVALLPRAIVTDAAGKAVLAGAAEPALESIAKASGEASLIGAAARRLLALPRMPTRMR